MNISALCMHSIIILYLCYVYLYHLIVLCNSLKYVRIIIVLWYLDVATAKLAQAHGWIKSGSHWSVKNQEEFIKPKKIISKIEFDSKY